MKIIGCFGMTEFGNGSSIQQFETTSTYDKQAQEFIIHSPTTTSLKWWIGAAAHTATHCIVFARLLIEGHDYGVHNFIVPLRDIATGTLLSGVTTGDVGAKWGRQGVDNGFIRFDQVRIPRMAMLQRWSQVAADGTYTSPAFPQLAYGALLGGRTVITASGAEVLKQALTIATRYGAVRKQHTIKGGVKGDPKQLYLLDLQTHQFRLLPLFAEAFALHFFAQRMRTDYFDMLEKLKSFDISSLADFHSTSSGMKAWGTWMAQDGIEVCRRSCGGHGYSQYTGLSTLLADFAVYITGEGDNMVMAQQNARVLLQALKKAKAGKTLTGSVVYLNDVHNYQSQTFEALLQGRTVAQAMQEDASGILCSVFRYAAICTLVSTAERVEKAMQHHESHNYEGGVWNECMVDLVASSRAHCYYLLVECFTAQVEQQAATKSGLFPILSKLRNLFALWHASQDCSPVPLLLLQKRYFLPDHIVALEDLVRSLISQLRPDLVALADAFHLPDLVVNSVIGNYSGNIYEDYLSRVMSSRLQTHAIQGKPDYPTTSHFILH
eukprot:TRINITY_DN1455_c0_g1_i3.p1 TRINITY_DN1455_c0_g1~~TRINITY_DN1455_c0_g1_i3.p1  ORF type:complete len:550 (+),score=70.82 TRINITY_DN1455_c0_g1_i3:444-2093(+)